MKVSQKALALLLSASMVISSFAGTAAFADGWTGKVGDEFDNGNYTFKITDSSVSNRAVELTALKTPRVDNAYLIPATAQSESPSYTYQVTSVALNVFLAKKAVKVTYKDYTVQDFGDVHNSGSVGLFTSPDGTAVYAEAYPNIEDHYVFIHWVDASGNVLTPPNPLQPNPYRFTNGVTNVYAVFAKKAITQFDDFTTKEIKAPFGMSQNALALPTKVMAHFNDESRKLLPITGWTLNPEYNPSKTGRYLFTPKVDTSDFNVAATYPTVTVTVMPNGAHPVTGVHLQCHNFRHVGALTTFQFNATINPSNADDKHITWISSNPNVATVDANGLMTMKSYGNTVITVKTEDGGYTDSCTFTIQSQDTHNQKINDTKDEVNSLPSASPVTIDATVAQKIIDAVGDVEGLGKDATDNISSAKIDNLEALLEKLSAADGFVSKAVTVAHDPTIIKDSAISEPPSVSGLLIAAGIAGDESTPTPVDLQMNQIVPTDSSALLAFEMNLTVDANEIHDLSIPVTVTFKLPDSFHYDSSRTYSIQHIKDDGDTESLSLTINGRYASFTTSSFSTFLLTSTANGGSSSVDPSGHSAGSIAETSAATSLNPSAAAFTSDTTADFTVNSNYQIRLTGTNGAAPVLTVGTPGVFETQLVKTSGNNFYFKLIAIGAPGAKAGIYVNGVKLLVATVGTTASSVRCDTTKPFGLKDGASYVIKLTAPSRPTLSSGNNSVFRVTAAGSVGYDGSNMRDYFFKVTAVGKVGGCTGLYVNDEKTPRTIAKIVK